MPVTSKEINMIMSNTFISTVRVVLFAIVSFFPEIFAVCNPSESS